jgi:hypothetical protein
MSIVALRRYLQPSATLRWHPWAPLVALLLALLMAFAFGFAIADRLARQNHGAEADVQAFFMAMRRLDENAGNPRGVLQEAAEMDRVVVRYVAMKRSNGWSLRGLQARILTGKTIDTLPMVKRVAEYRLGELSGSAPRWRMTAGYCSRAGAPSSGEDVTIPYERVARAYSDVLDRDVTAKELAPAVPGGVCQAKVSS